MNIILIGMMGSGKSFIGKNLSHYLNYEFIDLDDYIEKKLDLTISEIFNKYGENYFRKIESECLSELKKVNKTVISTGGGIILNSKNLSSFQFESPIIYLKASSKYILNNIKNDNSRPLLNLKNKEAEIIRLLNLRKVLYENQSNYTIDVSFRNIDKIIKNIVRILRIY